MICESCKKSPADFTTFFSGILKHWCNACGISYVASLVKF